MGEVCPTCGQPMPRRLLGTDDILALLRLDCDRYLYRSPKGTWHLTSHRGEADRRAVAGLIESGTVRPTYSTATDCFWLGRTIDIDATLAERKRSGNKKAIVYAD